MVHLATQSHPFVLCGSMLAYLTSSGSQILPAVLVKCRGCVPVWDTPFAVPESENITTKDCAWQSLRMGAS